MKKCLNFWFSLSWHFLHIFSVFSQWRIRAGKLIFTLSQMSHVCFRGNSNQNWSLKMVYSTQEAAKTQYCQHIPNHPFKTQSNLFWSSFITISQLIFTINFVIVTINFVIIRLKREGVWCKLALVTNFPISLGLPLLLDSCLS